MKLQAPSQDGLWTPPAIIPPDVDPHVLVLAARSPGNQIRGWSRKVFYEDVWRPAPTTPVLITQPEALRRIFLDEAEDFPQGSLFKRMFRAAWGKGVLTAEGASWRWQRHASATAFRPATVSELTPLIVAATERAVTEWIKTSAKAPIDLEPAITRLTFDIIVDTMLSGGEYFDRDQMKARIAAFFRDIGRIRLSYMFMPDAYHAHRPDVHSKLRAPLLADIRRMVSARRSLPARGDLVDLLLAATDPETGKSMDDALIADNIMGFILAGHETTSVGLTWAAYVLAAHPPTAQRIREEVRAVVPTGPITADHAPQLVYTRQVMSEVLRLYPPGFLLTRVAAKTCELAGLKVRAGTRINVPVYAIHRHRKRWRDPDAFDPTRFAPDAPPPDRYAYLPFGAGPRICMGAAFAMLESVVILATLVRRADLAFTGGKPPQPVAVFALRPRGGMPMRVTAAASVD